MWPIDAYYEFTDETMFLTLNLQRVKRAQERGLEQGVPELGELVPAQEELVLGPVPAQEVLELGPVPVREELVLGLEELVSALEELEPALEEQVPVREELAPGLEQERVERELVAPEQALEVASRVTSLYTLYILCFLTHGFQDTRVDFSLLLYSLSTVTNPM